MVAPESHRRVTLSRMKWYFDPEQRMYWSVGDGDDEIFVRQDAIQGQGDMAAVMLGVNLDGIQDAEERPVPRQPEEQEIRGT
jgi:hypothetical protein